MGGGGALMSRSVMWCGVSFVYGELWLALQGTAVVTRSRD